MATSEPNLYKATTAGDAAVEGLVHGIIAGVAMAAHLVVADLVGGDSPATMLDRFSLGSETSQIAGILGHLAVSGVYGIIWGLLWRSVHYRSGVPGFLAGIAYGLVLFLGSQVMLPAASSPLAAVPAVHLAVAHVIYGLVLGLWSGRWETSTKGKNTWTLTKSISIPAWRRCTGRPMTIPPGITTSTGASWWNRVGWRWT